MMNNVYENAPMTDAAPSQRITDIAIEILEMAKEQDRIITNIYSTISGFKEDEKVAKDAKPECLFDLLKVIRKMQEENIKKLYHTFERL